METISEVNGKLVLDRGYFYYLVSHKAGGTITGKKIMIGKED